MELSPWKFGSIISNQGNLLMGNSELTIMNRSLSINIEQKINFFKGYIPNGYWFVNHVQVYEVN